VYGVVVDRLRGAAIDTLKPVSNAWQRALNAVVYIYFLFSAQYPTCAWRRDFKAFIYLACLQHALMT
jgi:hypothetical protein